VGAVWQLPVGSCCNHTRIFPEGKEYPLADGPTSYLNGVSPSFFAAMEIPLKAGRYFTEDDDAGSPRVAIVDEVFARREWPGESALGKRLRLAAGDTSWVTVVGVVSHIVQRSVNERTDAQLFRPLAQDGYETMSFVLRAAGGDASTLVPAAKSVVQSLDRDLPLAHLQTMEDVIRDRMFQSRVYGSMFGIFALAALLLASIGLYGVMSYAVAQRTHEMGVRMALGARARDVVSLVMRGGARLIAAGLLIGVPAAFGLARLLEGLLYGVSASDPATFIAIPVALTIVAFVASYVPARRATRVDPNVALRSE
jgi:putative ABC transport system permease protein